MLGLHAVLAVGLPAVLAVVPLLRWTAAGEPATCAAAASSAATTAGLQLQCALEEAANQYAGADLWAQQPQAKGELKHMGHLPLSNCHASRYNR